MTLPTSLPVVAPAQTGVDYELFLDCVHCGLCLSACPTFVELGTEMDSPRGRIYLMRAATEGRVEVNAHVRRHLDLCLDCRACESACPSGVRYGQLIEPFRAFLARTRPNEGDLSWLQHLVVFHVFPHIRRIRLALTPVRWLQHLGLWQLLQARWVPRRLRQMAEMLPRLRSRPALPGVLPAEGTRRARVALFTGCVADAVFPETTVATARVLQRNGCEVVVPRTQTCCGAIDYHSGREAPAQRFAAANVAALCGVDAVIVNAAGCGAMLKDYGHLLDGTPQAAAGRELASRVRDVSEFLVELGPVKPEHPVALRATYHDACHLCHAQQIRAQPRDLLKMIPGMELLPLAEGEMCCGAAGTYNLTQPEMAGRLGERKADHIVATGAEVVLAGNVGCLMQISRHLRAAGSNAWVAHPVDLLWAAYSGRLPATCPTISCRTPIRGNGM
jgi:glycolate oxidase iron-sulfur subunit